MNNIYYIVFYGVNMAVKIMIDPGHGGYDNGATYGNRKEKDDNLKLALAVGQLLQDRGYDVEYTRTEDVYDSPLEKAQKGNMSGADYFISFHRNSSPTPNQYGGVQTLVYSDTGVKANIARKINSNLEEIGFRNINVDERPNLAVLKRTKMPAVLIETGFINNDSDNKLFDERFNDIAKGIADAIDETIVLSAGSMGMAQGAYHKQHDKDGKRDKDDRRAKDDKRDKRDMNDKHDMYDKRDMNDRHDMYDNRDMYDRRGMYDMNDINHNDGNGKCDKYDRRDNHDICDNGSRECKDQKNCNHMERDKDVEYKVVIGMYSCYPIALYNKNRLANVGYSCEIFMLEGLYAVCAGSYDSVDDANDARMRLRKKGCDSLIIKYEKQKNIK